MICGCGSVVESVRAELGLKVCKTCAFSGPDVPRPKGRMVYSGKVGGEIEILSARSWEENKNRFAPHGARSAVKNFSKNVCS
jgi:hypothetical protein